jgi:hypothetical protein
MRGFCEDVLFALPEFDTYEHQTYTVQQAFDRDLTKLVEYVRGVGIKPFFFNHDLFALTLWRERVITDVFWVNSFSRDDIIYAGRTQVNDQETLPIHKEYLTITDAAREKYPTRRGLTEDERFDIMKSRCKFSANEILKQFRFVISLESPHHEQYKVRKGNKNDERMIWRLHPTSNKVEAFLSGEPIPIQDVMNWRGAGFPLDRWDIKEALKCI